MVALVGAWQLQRGDGGDESLDAIASLEAMGIS
jgi:hypothetical protein